MDAWRRSTKTRNIFIFLFISSGSLIIFHQKNFFGCCSLLWCLKVEYIRWKEWCVWLMIKNENHISPLETSCAAPSPYFLIKINEENSQEHGKFSDVHVSVSACVNCLCYLEAPWTHHNAQCHASSSSHVQWIDNIGIDRIFNMYYLFIVSSYIYSSY